MSFEEILKEGIEKYNQILDKTSRDLNIVSGIHPIPMSTRKEIIEILRNLGVERFNNFDLGIGIERLKTKHTRIPIGKNKNMVINLEYETIDNHIPQIKNIYFNFGRPGIPTNFESDYGLIALAKDREIFCPNDWEKNKNYLAITLREYAGNIYAKKGKVYINQLATRTTNLGNGGLTAFIYHNKLEDKLKR